jgi:hypothetical protein
MRSIGQSVLWTTTCAIWIGASQTKDHASSLTSKVRLSHEIRFWDVARPHIERLRFESVAVIQPSIMASILNRVQPLEWVHAGLMFQAEL